MTHQAYNVNDEIYIFNLPKFHLPKSDAMERSTDLTSSSLSNRPTYSCIRCSDRKVRCDRQNPCSTCIKHDVQCLFRTVAPRRKKLKRVKLKDKLGRYEALLQQLGADPDRQSMPETEQCRIIGSSEAVMTENASQVQNPVSNDTEKERSITTSQLLQGQGRSKLIDNSLWSRVVQEFYDSEEALEDSSSEASDASDSDDDHSFVLDVVKKPKNRYSHPTVEHIQQLWQIFVDNIDPLTKIVHVPSLDPAIQKATTNIEKVPRNFEPLMFAIYAIAIVSLNDEECKHKFRETREVLLSRYTSATKWALSRAKFMGTMSIVVLQALTLHIFAVRNVSQPRTVWTLTGVAIRIAQGLGLHRDGASMGVPPFEAEIRARIWWQLKMHDFRATELIGLAKFRSLNPVDETCKPPANINDNELYPGMLSPATPSTKLTDMTFLVFKTELANFARRQETKMRRQEKNTNYLDDIAARSNQKTKEKLVEELEEVLEGKYLRYCDPAQPLQLLTMLVARSSVNVVRFLTHHPRRWANQERTPKSEQEYIWKTSIALLEQYGITQSDRRLHGFAWYSDYYLHWHVLIHVLDTLRAEPLRNDSQKAWRLIEAMYRYNPDMTSSTKKPIHVAVGNLCLNAFNVYEAALMHEGMNISKEPDYITKLRQQREGVKARRKARDAKSHIVPSYRPLQAIDTKIRPDCTTSRVKASFDTEEYPSYQVTGVNQGSEGEPFWLTNCLDNGKATQDMMDIDADLMLAQGYDFTDQSVDWTQLDALLGEQIITQVDDSAGSTLLN